METFKIFIVEDDPWYGELLTYHLSLNPDYEVIRFGSGKECLSNLHQKPHVVSLDYNLPDYTGADILRRIKEITPEAQVIIISAQNDVGTAVNLLKEGAYDYIVKDDDAKDRLWNTIIRVRENASLRQEIETLREEIVQKYDFSNSIKGNSPAIQKVFSLLEKAVRTNITVSIKGETGTGKEMVAKAIHYTSESKKKPFVAVNVAAIPKDLIESELFGYEKGAFTGAATRRIGKFEEAEKGTLFLDEVAEMDLNMQTKLLRVLQERELTRIGGNETVKLDFRLIVATHKNLPEEIKKGNFREDLYYRIMGLTVELPPLRERGNDVLLLAKFFIDEFSSHNKMKAPQLSPEAKSKLMAYGFPGNIRELKAVMELAAVLSNGKEIMADDITFHQGSDDASAFLLEEKTLKDYTTMIIKYYLKKYDNNVVQVAKKLDIGKSTIYNLIQSGSINLVTNNK
jgi:DNA-binding NtrC family response regulator